MQPINKLVIVLCVLTSITGDCGAEPTSYRSLAEPTKTEAIADVIKTQKKQDVRMLNQRYEACCDIEYYESGAIRRKQCDPQCVSFARLQEREQRRQGGQQITNGILGAVGLFVSGLTLFD